MIHKDNFNIGKWINENKATNEIKVIPGNKLLIIQHEVIKKLEAEYQMDPDYNRGYLDAIEQLKLAQDIKSLERIVGRYVDDQYEFLFPIYRKLLLKQ